MPEVYTGDEGDDALAGGLPVMDGTEDRRDGWLSINKTRDLIVAALTAAKAYADGLMSAVSWGSISGTPTYVAAGASQSAARGVIDAAASSHGHSAAAITGGDFPGAAYGFAGDIFVADDIFMYGGTVATSGWTVMYMDASGRISVGASSQRYKEAIRSAGELGDLFAAPLREYRMKDGDGTDRVGYIAEELLGTDMERFVVYGPADRKVQGSPLVVQSIDFIALLMAQNAQLHERDQVRSQQLAELADRIAALEGNA
jgi:hypothetical protein